MKNFVKALHKNGAAFQHLSTVFPGLSAAQPKEGIFVGPQIREVLKDTAFEEQNTPDLLRKHSFDCLWYYELCNCVIQVYWFNQCSLSILFYLL